LPREIVVTALPPSPPRFLFDDPVPNPTPTPPLLMMMMMMTYNGCRERMMIFFYQSKNKRKVFFEFFFLKFAQICSKVLKFLLTQKRSSFSQKRNHEKNKREREAHTTSSKSISLLLLFVAIHFSIFSSFNLQRIISSRASHGRREIYTATHASHTLYAF
jgi:hypothetical protein